jgi:hypothetical protein
MMTVVIVISLPLPLVEVNVGQLPNRELSAKEMRPVEDIATSTADDDRLSRNSTRNRKLVILTAF